MSSLRLTNPHSVLAVLETRPLDVLEVHAGVRSQDAWKTVAEQARRLGITVREPIARSSGGRKPGPDGGRIGSTYALVRERAGVPLEELFAAPGSRALFLALDQLQDPHNVGAIFRTAAFFGVAGIVLTVDRSAPLTATVYDVASGGVELVPFCLQTNLARALELAKQHDCWVLGSSEHAELDADAVDRDRRWLLVVGNEERGLRRLTAEHCDQLCRIRPHGSLQSLNASVATAVLLSTLQRPVG